MKYERNNQQKSAAIINGMALNMARHR